VHHADWWFSAEKLNGFALDIENRSSWKYTGGTDLIVTTVRYKEKTRKASLDFRSALVINLEAMVSDKAVSAPTQLMFQMFHFVQTMNEDTKNPVWKFSDEMGFRVLKAGFLARFWKTVTGLFGSGVQGATHFAVRDISPK
jgi:hypothetical protein